MALIDTLASSALEAIIAGVLLGMVLVFAVALALKLLTPVNAATRYTVWITTLAALPLVPALYLMSHFSAPIPAPTIKPPAIQQKATSPVITASARPIKAAAPARAVNNYKVYVPVPRELPLDAFAVYGIVVSLLLFRLAVSYLRLCLLRRRTQPAPDELQARLQHWLARCPTLRRVELRVSQSARSPLAIGWLRPVIVMPAALVLELSREDFDDLGVHELAHIRRYDDWTNLLQRIMQAFLFFHPAAHYISGKLNLAREIACDDWVVSSHESKAYARCLAKIVELRRYQRGSLVLSSGAFFGKGQLLKRVEALLDKRRNAATGISSLTMVLVVIVLTVAAAEIVHLPAVLALTRQEHNTSSMRWSDDSRDLRMDMRGDIAFSPDDRSVSSLSPGGFLSIDDAEGWSHRRIELRPGPNGAPEEKYFLDGQEKPLDGVGRAWAAGKYLFLLRETGLDAEARVGRIFAQRGASGVLEEVDLIHSDHVKSEYLTLLMERGKLTPGDLQRVADSARKISSDNDKAEFLLAHREEFATDGLRTSYFRAVNSISSDNDRRRVLTGMLETDGHTPETARLVGISAKGMSSDNDKAEVLLAIPTGPGGDPNCALLNAARTIQSDNDKARVLQDASYIDAAPCRDAYFAVVNLIQSDNDRSNVLQSLLRQPSHGAETYADIANSARTMHSDNDKANVLAILGERYSGAPFFDAANTIESSNDRARVLKVVLQHEAGPETLLGVIGSAAGISGDSEKADILLAAAQQAKTPEVRAALQQACGKISSDNDYRRVASAIFQTDLPKRPGQ